MPIIKDLTTCRCTWLMYVGPCPGHKRSLDGAMQCYIAHAELSLLIIHIVIRGGLCITCCNITCWRGVIHLSVCIVRGVHHATYQSPGISAC